MKEKRSWFIGISGVIVLIFFLMFFLNYFKYVSIGQWIAMENYVSKGEWFKQMGLFIATMWGFYMTIRTFAKWLDWFPKFKRKNKNANNEKR